MTSPDCFVISLVKNHLEIRNKVRVAPLCIRDGLKHAKEKVGKLILTANFYTLAIHVTKSLTILAKNLLMSCNIVAFRIYCTANCTQAHHCKPFWYILWSDFFAHLLTVYILRNRKLLPNMFLFRYPLASCISTTGNAFIALWVYPHERSSVYINYSIAIRNSRTNYEENLSAQLTNNL